MSIDGGVGTRGGNVRSVEEARDLQTASKPLDRWRLVMEEQIFRTLLATDHFHIDDLDCLDLPPEAFAVRGTLVRSVSRRGVMRKTGEERKVSHKAANGRPAPIYEITAEGREQLPKLAGLSSGSSGEVDAAAQSGERQEIAGPTAAAEDVVRAPRSGRSGLPGDLNPASAKSPVSADEGAPASRPPAADAGSLDSLIQLEGVRKAPSMYDAWEGEAA